MKSKIMLLFVLLMVGILLSAQAVVAVPTAIVFDDMEHGDPFGNGWFSFGGAVGACIVIPLKPKKKKEVAYLF